MDEKILLPEKLPKSQVLEVVVLLTPDQLLAIYDQNPHEWAFTRQLITWNATGRPEFTPSFHVKYIARDKNKLKVVPIDDNVPAFYIPYT